MGVALWAGTVSPRVGRPRRRSWISGYTAVYISMVAEHLVDIDEDALAAARAEAGMVSMKDTVDEARRRATGPRPSPPQPPGRA